MEKKNVVWKNASILVGMVLLFLGVCVFTNITMSEYPEPAWLYLLSAAATVGAVYVAYELILCFWYWNIDVTWKKLMVWVGVFSGGVVYYTILCDFYTYSSLWERIFYDGCNLILYPVLLMLIGKMKQSKKNKMAGILAIVLFDAVSIFFSYEWGGVFLEQMALIRIAALYAAYKKNDCRDRYKKERLKCMGIYACFWFVIVGVIEYLTSSIGEHAFFLQKKDYFLQFLSQIKMFGKAELTGEFYCLREEVLCQPQDPVQTCLYFGGWIPTVIYILVFVLFLVSMYRCLGRKYRIYKEFYPVYVAAFVHLLTRFVAGMMNSFLLIRFSGTLPFSGKGYIFDMAATVICFLSFCENLYLKNTLFPAEDYKVRSLEEYDANAGAKGVYTFEEMDDNHRFMNEDKKEVVTAEPWLVVKMDDSYTLYKIPEAKEIFMVKVIGENEVMPFADEELITYLMKKYNMKNVNETLWDNCLYTDIDEEDEDDEEE